jgi:hypothetical protein
MWKINSFFISPSESKLERAGMNTQWESKSMRSQKFGELAERIAFDFAPKCNDVLMRVNILSTKRSFEAERKDSRRNEFHEEVRDNC